MAIMLISAPTTLEGKSDSIRVIFVAFLLGNCNAQNSPEHTKVHIKCLCSNRNHKSKLTHFKKQNCCHQPPSHLVRSSSSWRLFSVSCLAVVLEKCWHCWCWWLPATVVTCLPWTEFGNDNLVCNGPSWVTRDSTTNHSYHDIVAWAAWPEPTASTLESYANNTSKSVRGTHRHHRHCWASVEYLVHQHQQLIIEIEIYPVQGSDD